MKVNLSLPVIRVAGGDYERGLQIGKMLSGKISQNVDYYMKMWASTGTRADTVLDLSAKFAYRIKSYAPHIFAEMAGISAGSARSFDEIVALNCRWELFYISGMSNECTSIGMNGNVTKECHTFLAQNWDYMPAVRDGCAIISEVQEPNRPNILMHTEAGVVGQKGFNSDSLGIVVNGLSTYDDRFEVRIPFLVMLREVLNQRNMDDAISVVRKTERAVSGNMMIAQADGEIIDIECTAEEFSMIREENGRLNHANTFCSVEFDGKVRDKIRDIYPDSMLRHERSRVLLDSKNSHQDGSNIMKEILMDHANAPTSICRHSSGKSSVATTETVTLISMIMDLDDKVLLYANGNPCSNPFQRIDAADYWR